MKQNRRPLNKKGDRNALCPYYSDCLDEAVEKSWRYWDCCECTHKTRSDPTIGIQRSFNDAVILYELPMNFDESRT